MRSPKVFPILAALTLVGTSLTPVSNLIAQSSPGSAPTLTQHQHSVTPLLAPEAPEADVRSGQDTSTSGALPDPFSDPLPSVESPEPAPMGGDTTESTTAGTMGSPDAPSSNLDLGEAESLGVSNQSEDTASATGLKRPASPIERALLKVEIAETTYGLEQSLENKAALLQALEKVVELKCMPRLLIDLQFNGGLGNEFCMEAVRKVFAIDSASPIGFCARDGIDSKNCLDAARNQVVGPYGEPYRGPPDLNSIRAGSRLTIADSSALMLSQAKQLRSGLSGKDALRNRLQMRTIFDRLLTLNCSVTRLALREAPQMQQHHQARKDQLLSQPLPQNVPVEQYVDALVKGAGGKEDQDEASLYGPAHYRMRMVSEPCLYFIREALSAEKDMATAICHREGFPTPQCIDALRKQRQSTLAEIQKARAAQGLPTLNPQQLQSGIGIGSGAPTGTRRPIDSGFSTF